MNKSDHPTAPPAQKGLREAIECLESLGIRLAAEAKSTATKTLRAKQCEIRSKAIFTVLDAFKTLESEREQYATKQIERQTPAIEQAAREEGIRFACAVVDEMYGRCNTHKFMQGDCVLAKLNMLDKSKLRPNPVDHEAAIIERFVEEVDKEAQALWEEDVCCFNN